MSTHLRQGNGLRRLVLCAVALGAVASVSPAGAGTTTGAGPDCRLASSDLGETLTRTRFQLTQGRTLTIVAIGSSSTEGAGASSASAAYPARWALRGPPMFALFMAFHFR